LHRLAKLRPDVVGLAHPHFMFADPILPAPVVDALDACRWPLWVLVLLLLTLTGLLWRQRARLHRALHDTQLGASVFRHAQEGILITDAQGRIVDVNQSFSRITGYRRDEVLGRSPRMLGSGRHDKAFYQQMWQSLLTAGRWHGEIWNRRKSGEVYAEVLTITALYDDHGALQHHLAVFSDITAQKEHQKQLELIAHYDVLTGLPNRSLLADRLQQALAQAQRRETLVALVFLDLDGFKAVNDTLGHDAGDRLLQELGRRMKDVLRDGDTLARVGGDEFVAVLGDVSGTGDCERVLHRLLEVTSAPVLHGTTSAQVSASLGVALYPQDGTEADMLMRHADQAMYCAKELGKNRFHFFDAGEDEDARHRRQQVDQVARALEAGQFELYYQPKVNMRHGRVLGAEALIRWNHPDGTVHGPASFLPGIEGHPLSATVGRWVLETAMTQMETWAAQGLHLPLSVNVSAYHLQQKDFADQVRQLLLAHPNLPPHSLQLEVLETSALQDMAWVAEVIQACTQLGVDFALDDFGTGYSSLTYLKRLPAHVLKIDQSFVRDMLCDTEDLTIVEGVISLAHAFGRTVVAEGVETTDHGAMLLRLGCDHAQGYGVARPMPAAALVQWAQTWQPPQAWAAHQHRVPSRRDLPFVLAEVEHRDWLEKLRRHLDNRAHPAPVARADDCQFGRVVKGLLANGTLSPSDQLQALLAQHDQVHAHCERVLATQGQRDEQELTEALVALEQATSHLLHLLHHFEH
jgi:diguanylate cyclase (GGDEF)-like protein/PAS domain S-box-containing protein